jgi:flagellar hook capping protein FlgD
VILGNLRVHRLVRTALLATIGTLLAVSSASAHTIVRKQSDFFWQSTPLTYTPGRGTPAIAETTIRHQVYFSDLEGSTAGWSTINFRANKPVQWAIVSGAHACTGNSWWCGQVGLPHGDGYGNNWIQSLTTAVPINIAGSTSPQLTFKMRLQSEPDLDIAWVLIRGSNPGARWDTLAFYSGNVGTSCVNKTLAIPDSFKTVMQPIALQFLFGSDISFSAEDTTGAYTGWSLDDIAVKSSAGTVTHFFDDMESGSSKWTAVSPNPGVFWHLETAPTTSQPASCFFLNTNVWVPFQGVGFGSVPDYADQMLTTPPMYIQGVFSPNTPTKQLRLQFDQWINLPDQNSVYWSIWIQGSDSLVNWTPWRNANDPFEYSGGSPQCTEGLTTSFNPYDSVRTGVGASARYIRLGIRLRDSKAIDGCGCGGPRALGVTTEGMYVDNLGVYYVYTISGVEPVSGVPVASRPTIDKAFPNPFNPMTTIQFSVPESGPVRVGIIDVQGRAVATLVNETMRPGVYRIRWSGKNQNGGDVASGVYYAQVQSRGGADAERVVLIK